jgi:hypothetical protein
MKTFRPLLILLFFFSYLPGTFAQENNNMFTAKDGWMNTKGDYQSYELVMALAQGTSDSSSIINLENGTSDVWNYIYRNINDENDVILIYVIKDGDDYFPLLLSDNESISNKVKKLDDVNWYDSDYFIQELNKNEYFTKYIADNSPIDNIFITLSYIYDDEGGGIPSQFVNQFDWIIEMDKGFQCIMNAVTGELMCNNYDDAEDVKLLPVDNISIFPQPANDVINLILPEGIDVTSIEIYNLFGMKMSTGDNDLSSSLIQIQITDYAAGTYILKINTNTQTYIRKFSRVN